jgi:hypothetical protein
VIVTLDQPERGNQMDFYTSDYLVERTKTAASDAVPGAAVRE